MSAWDDRAADDLAAALATGRVLSLLGFMAAGKTRVGRELGRLTGLAFFDLDHEVEHRAGMSVEEIFARLGEPRFRELEADALRDLCGASGVILACGGGTVLREENRRILGERSVRIWLQVSREEVLERLKQPDTPRRPLLAGADLPALVDALFREREAFYQESDLVVATDGRAIGQIAREIARRLRIPLRADHRG